MIPFGTIALCYGLAICLSFAYPWLVHPSRQRSLREAAAVAPFVPLVIAGILSGVPILLILAILCWAVGSWNDARTARDQTAVGLFPYLTAYVLLLILFVPMIALQSLGWMSAVALGISALVVLRIWLFRDDEDLRNFRIVYILTVALLLSASALIPHNLPIWMLGAAGLIGSDANLSKAKPMVMLKVPRNSALLFGQVSGFFAIIAAFLVAEI